MNAKPLTVNRTLVGVIALVLLVVSLVLAVTGVDTNDIWTGACLKVGLVMGALWLALPSITSNPILGRATWASVLTVVAGAIVIAKIRIPLHTVLPVLGALLFLVRFLGPRRVPPRT
jgi:hypothetical protein